MKYIGTSTATGTPGAASGTPTATGTPGSATTPAGATGTGASGTSSSTVPHFTAGASNTVSASVTGIIAAIFAAVVAF